MRFALLIAFVMTLGLAAHAEGWQTIVALDGRTSVEMPAGTTASSPIRRPSAVDHRWVFKDGNGGGFALLFSFIELSPPPENRAGLLSEIQTKVLAQLAGSVLERETVLQRGSFSGREVVVSYERDRRMILTTRFFVSDARLVQVVAVSSAAQRHDPRIARFFESLKLP
jgi:hypothetical protein